MPLRFSYISMVNHGRRWKLVVRMPLKCQFCLEESVVEEDVGDGREQLICVECGAVATLAASQLSKCVQLTVDQTGLERDDACEADVCQSCGDELQPGDSRFCCECKNLEQETEVNCSTNQQNDYSVIANYVNTQNDVEKKVDIAVVSNPKVQVCPSCGGLEVIVDELGTEEQIVCKSCGQVVGNQIFTTNEPENSSTRTFGNSQQKLPFFARRPGQCNGFKTGIEKISFVHQKLALSNHIKEDAVGMFERLFYMPLVVNKTVQTKEHIAVACVYVACRRDSLPVCMIHFQDFRDSNRLFIRALKMVTSLLDIKLLPPAFGTLVRQTFHSVKLGAGSADSAKMLTQVRDIMFLCRDAWLTSGRHCQPIVLIAIYYVYLSSDVCPKHITFSKFCSKFHLPPISKKMLYDFQKLFLRLASHLPWAKQGQVKHSTIHLYIEDILQYKKSLIHLAFEKPELGKECSPWEVKSELDNSSRLSDSSLSTAPLKKEILVPASFKRAREAKPVVRYPEPQIPSHLNLDCPEIKATDFPEEEISSYLLTTAELDSIKEVKENLFKEKKPRLK
ncbi:transcription factor IIIB 50 kDa subunit [Elysia marginata]|uniref:Transcription factor IIIB 50 kDa subunit n=1 Tax=Elysia marginata TaxID=1093978 RepID=A0AAV4F4Q0_9GAST|nr:transcription factor IIIB 50 kDa subunit [Elysia marginata]